MTAADPWSALRAVASTRRPLNAAVFDWCLENARHALAGGRSRWAAVREATAGRVVTAGPQPDVRLYHDAADGYLEGFPFGSPTALLEVAQRGLPCVRAPRCVSPPFAFDGPALAGLDQPLDLADYARAAIALVDDPQERRRQGLALAASVRRHHAPLAWLDRLREALPRRLFRRRGHVLPRSRHADLHRPGRRVAGAAPRPSARAGPGHLARPPRQPPRAGPRSRHRRGAGSARRCRCRGRCAARGVVEPGVRRSRHETARVTDRDRVELS